MVRWLSLSSAQRKPKSEGEEGGGPGCRPSSDTSVLGQNIRARDPCQVKSTETRPPCLAVHSSEWHESCACAKKIAGGSNLQREAPLPTEGGLGPQKSTFSHEPREFTDSDSRIEDSTESGFFLDSKHTRAGSLSDSHPSIEITEHRVREG